jgi:hypothetical protein
MSHPALVTTQIFPKSIIASSNTIKSLNDPAKKIVTEKYISTTGPPCAETSCYGDISTFTIYVVSRLYL